MAQQRQLRTPESWAYLAAIIDLFSGRLIGWAVRNRMERNLAVRAPHMAIRCLAADGYIRERGNPKAAAICSGR